MKVDGVLYASFIYGSRTSATRSTKRSSHRWPTPTSCRRCAEVKVQKKMKKHPMLLCYLLSSFLHCILVVFALLIFSGPAEAMPRVYPCLLPSPCGEDAYNVTGSGCDNPDDHWNFTIQMLKHPTDAYQNACKSFLHPASKAAPPLSTTSVSFIFTDNAAAGRKIPTTSYATLNVAPQEPGIDPGESNRQSPLKAGLLNLGIRGTLSSVDVIGADAPEEFRA